MGKLSKMLYMIDLLNTGNKYSLKELSEKLNISPRMIRYYKDELIENGIFIESFKGPGGGYFLIDKTKNYTYLNKYDIKLLENIENYLKQTDFTFKDNLKNLIEKVKNMHTVAEDKSKFLATIDLTNKYNIEKRIKNALKQEEMINITYQNIDGNIINRNIHPLQTFKYKEIIYITAYCELRKDIRHFELNRIKKVK